MGMHRGSQLADMFRGTPVERIIRPSKIPVLLAKETVRAPYSNVMVGVDFSVYSRRAVEFAVRFVPGGSFRLVQEGMVREVLQRQIGRQKPIYWSSAPMVERGLHMRFLAASLKNCCANRPAMCWR